MTKRDTNPFLNPAIAAELTMRERKALMDTDDWALLIDRVLKADDEQ